VALCGVLLEVSTAATRIELPLSRFLSFNWQQSCGSFRASQSTRLPDMNMCTYCQAIPWSFFKDDSYINEYSFHPSYETLTTSAESGCRFCLLLFRCSERQAANLPSQRKRILKGGDRIILRRRGHSYHPKIDYDFIYEFMVEIGDPVFPTKNRKESISTSH